MWAAEEIILDAVGLNRIRLSSKAKRKFIEHY